MTEKTPKPQKASQSRDERLKAALKANMGKRKAQKRARNDGPSTGSVAQTAPAQDAAQKDSDDG